MHGMMLPLAHHLTLDASTGHLACGLHRRTEECETRPRRSALAYVEQAVQGHAGR